MEPNDYLVTGTKLHFRFHRPDADSREDLASCRLRRGSRWRTAELSTLNSIEDDWGNINRDRSYRRWLKV